MILGSAILYRDFEAVKPERMLKFCTGCALTFWGVWMISSRRKERVWEDDEDIDGGYGTGGAAASIDLGQHSLDGDSRKGKHSRVGSISIAGIPIHQGLSSSDLTSSATPRPGAARPMAARAISNGPMAALEASPSGTPTSRTGSYINPSPGSKPPSRLISEPQIPSQDGASISRRPSRSGTAGGHRHSVSTLLPGSIVAGYQLKVVVGDLVGGRAKRDEDAGEGLEVRRA